MDADLHGRHFRLLLPNLRFFERVTTFGNLHCTFPTHSIQDIAAITALAVIDPRTANKAVQLYANVVTQAQLIQTLKRLWPNHPFEFEHVSTETISHFKEHGDPNKISAKAGADPIVGVTELIMQSMFSARWPACTIPILLVRTICIRATTIKAPPMHWPTRDLFSATSATPKHALCAPARGGRPREGRNSRELPRHPGLGQFPQCL
jgi:hypothetical protein